MQHENLQGQDIAETDYIMYSQNYSNYHQQLVGSPLQW